MLIASGFVIIIGMVYALIKRYETRMVLLTGGMLLAIIAGKPLAPLIEFSASMKQSNVFEVIISSMGFASVVKLTSCDKHLIIIFVKLLKRMGPFVIIGVAIATTIINSAIPSAAGTAAAVGTIMIPLLISAKVPAPIAAATVMSGLYGGNLNPGHVHPTIVAELAGKTSMEFVAVVALPIFGSVIASSIMLILLSIVMKKRKLHNDEGNIADESVEDDGFRANYFYAIIPLLPLIVLLLGNMNIVPMLKMPVSHAMILGAVVALIATRSNPGNLTNAFFKGMGESFGAIFGLIIAANIFVAGMNAIGLIQSLIGVMSTSPLIAKVASVVGPFGIAVLCGSGEAAAIALNNAVSVHAEKFGLDIMSMGAMTVLSGGIGRSLSPVAGCMIICAGIAKVSPLDVVKYNALPMLAALITAATFLYVL